jgi:hypothetical protein
LAGRRFWATGPGTTRALLRAGVPPEAIDAPPPEATRFDSEALWERVHAQVAPGVRVLIVRGGDEAGQPTGRDWLANEIDAAGGLRDTVVAYRRLPPTFDEANASSRSTVQKAVRSGSSAAPRRSATCSARCPAPTGTPPAPSPPMHASAKPRGPRVSGRCVYAHRCGKHWSRR